jgi:hypothetical protein
MVRYSRLKDFRLILHLLLGFLLTLTSFLARGSMKVRSGNLAEGNILASIVIPLLLLSVRLHGFLEKPI